jgi:DNA-binding GntR family transcriptional regulator
MSDGGLRFEGDPGQSAGDGRSHRYLNAPAAPEDAPDGTVSSQIALLSEEGLDDATIAAQLGFSIGTVNAWRTQLTHEGAANLPPKLDLAANRAALQPLKREALRDQVVRAIRDAIIQGKLRPGEKVPEGDLAQQLTVSRTPIREAIRVLEGQGLVEVNPKRGTYIAMPDRADAADGLAVRAALEILAVQQAIERADENDWNELCGKLEEILDGMAAASKSGDIIRGVELDIEFHATLMKASRNRHLWRSWHAVGIPFLVWFPERELYPTSPPDLVERHREVLDAIMTQDPQVCADAIRIHLSQKLADITL